MEKRNKQRELAHNKDSRERRETMIANHLVGYNQGQGHRGRIREFVVNTLGAAVVVGTLSGAVWFSNYQEEKILHGNKGTVEVYPTGELSTYWDFAEDLRRKYPRLKHVHMNALVDYVRDVNGDKPLRSGEPLRLPDYSHRK